MQSSAEPIALSFSSIGDLIVEVTRLEAIIKSTKDAEHCNLLVETAQSGLEQFSADIDNHSRGLLLLHISRAYMISSRYKEYMAAATESLACFERNGDLNYVLQANEECGHATWLLGRFPDSLGYALRNLDISRQIGDVKKQGRALNNIGSIYSRLGDYVAAVENFELALDIKLKTEDALGESSVLGNIGTVYHQKNDYPAALEYYSRSLEIKERLGEKQLAIATLNNMGGIYMQTGDNKRAFELLSRASSLSQEAGDSEREIAVWGYLGEVYERMKNYDKAAYYLNKAFDNISHIQTNYRRHVIYSQVAVLYANRSFKDCDIERARFYFMQALDIALEGKAMVEAAKYYKLLSNLEKEDLNIEAAFSYLEKHIEINKILSNRSSEERLHALQVRHRVEQLHNEAQIERLRNIELVEANKQLAELNAEKNTILGIAAHDLKNPLGSIKLAANFIQGHIDSMTHDDVRDMASDILRSSSYMFSIISNLLDINALESGKVRVELAPCDVAAVVRMVTDGYRARAAEKNIGLRVNISDEASDCVIVADTHRLREALENLISNAIKFSPFDKSVDIDVELFCGENLRIIIRDYGPGISAEDMPKLFGKFQKLSARPTAGEDSTGLGLSIVQKLAELMNGRVWCESVEGEGASFTLEFHLFKE